MADVACWHVSKERLEVQPAAFDRIQTLPLVDAVVPSESLIQFAHQNLPFPSGLDGFTSVKGSEFLPKFLLRGAVVVGSRRFAYALSVVGVILDGIRGATLLLEDTA